MARKSTGQVVVRDRVSAQTYALRFRAYGARHYVTLGSSREGWSEQRAATELQNVMADVRRGIWQPPDTTAATEAYEPPPTFHEFASEWLHSRTPELSARTVEDYQWALECHLLPFFAAKRVDVISIQDVDRYRASKVREREDALVERPLGNSSINKTITRLAQILDVAIEYGHLQSNPARGRRRRLKPEAPRRVWLETDQVRPLLDAAEEHRALLATLVLAGLRVSELTALRWSDVDLAAGRLHVRRSKTHAGARDVDLSPGLREELTLLRLRAEADADAFVFATRNGTRRDRNAVLKRILRPAVCRANVELLDREMAPIPGNLTTHGLRHTFASLLFEAGASVPYVMAQLGHAEPTVTLRIYAHVLKRSNPAGARLDELVGPSVTTPAIEQEPLGGRYDRSAG